MADRFEAIHHRHIYVDEVHQVTIIAALVTGILHLGLGEFDRFVPVEGDINFWFEPSIDYGLQCQNIEVFIIDYENFGAALLR